MHGTWKISVTIIYGLCYSFSDCSMNNSDKPLENTSSVQGEVLLRTTWTILPSLRLCHCWECLLLLQGDSGIFFTHLSKNWNYVILLNCVYVCECVLFLYNCKYREYCKSKRLVSNKYLTIPTLITLKTD